MTSIGALFAGYGGLEMGVQAVLGGDLAWYSEIDKGALKILTHHHPDVPNIGDVTTADWSTVPRVDILTGGSPCQDLSHAGKRAGMTEGTRSNLWVAMREAIAQLRPGLVIWENVRGAYSAEADSDLEHCPGCMGDRRPGTVLRALGRVLGDLSDLGYDAGWHGLRAADVGAPHGRFRVFVVAYPHDGRRREYHAGLGRVPVADPHSQEPLSLGNRGGPQHPDKRKAGGHSVTLQDAVHGILPRPRSSDGNGAGAHGDGGLDLRSAVALLPTPNPFHAGNTESPDDWRNRRLDVFKRTGTRHGPALSVVAWSIADGNPLDPDHYMPDEPGDTLCTSSTTAAPPTSESESAANSPTTSSRCTNKPASVSTAGSQPASSSKHSTAPSSRTEPDWGVYSAAVARWEAITGRPAPAPTMTSAKGNPQLAPAFVEWMMGLPAGHVTDTPGITRNEALKALGNGVVPQQAEAALWFLLPVLGIGAAA